ncbi:MAG: hypothetical protein Q9220_000722 [cf. Caloplaca sp. 1 TL-2023]
MLHKDRTEKEGLPATPLPPSMAAETLSKSSPSNPPPISTQPSAPSYSTPRILHIYLDGYSHRHLTIADMDKTHPLYTITQNSGSSMFSSKPHMRITHPSTSAPIGSATFHSWSRAIDLDFHGTLVAMESEGIMTRSYSYMSPAFGERLKWKYEGTWGSDLVLVNERKEWIARFESSVFAMKKQGKLHVVHGGIGGAALDEVVVGGMAFIEHERRRRRSNNSAAAGGGAAGVAIGC